MSLASRRALILASRSPARARMLADAGASFTIEPVEVDEDAHKHAALTQGASPREIALSLAMVKAKAGRGPGRLVLGADQTLELDGALFDKPADLDAVREQLRALRGRRHRLHAAAALDTGDGPAWQGVQSVEVQVRMFSDAFLDRYIAAEGEALLGCVGAYRLEGLGAQLIEAVEGDYFAVLGLPLLPLLERLRELGLMER